MRVFIREIFVWRLKCVGMWSRVLGRVVPDVLPSSSVSVDQSSENSHAWQYVLPKSRGTNRPTTQNHIPEDLGSLETAPWEPRTGFLFSCYTYIDLFVFSVVGAEVYVPITLVYKIRSKRIIMEHNFTKELTQLHVSTLLAHQQADV